jgi:predicted Zn finger-like uncharacterized protein
VKISCPSCSAKYSISDEKVVSRLAKIRCRKCGTTIVIDGKTNPPQVTASAGGEPTDDHGVHEQTEGAGTEYSVDLGEGDQRTLPLSEIVAAYNAGQITGETFVWADGFPDWKPLSEVEEIVDALHQAAAGSHPAAAAAPVAVQAQPSPVRAAARPARAGASDLFGRIEHAGGEDDVATSAPEPAGGGSGAGTGARNESSVLFSLSALTSATAPSKPSAVSAAAARSSTTASRDDSGLIDLKALTAAAVKAEGAAAAPAAAPVVVPLAPSPLGVAAPLGLGSPLGGALGTPDFGAPQKSKTGLFIAIAIVAAAVIVALAVILRPAPPPPIVQAPPPPPPVAAPAPTPTPTLAAAPPPTGSAEEAAAPEKKATTVRKSSGVKKPASGTSSPPAGGSEPAAPAKPKSKCGCASGDLQCAMRCAAKGG